MHRSVVVKSGAVMDAAFSTFADIGTTVRYDAGSAGYLEGNIIWPHTGIGNGLVAASGSTVTGSCNVGMGVGGLGASNTVANPNFVVTARGRYRITAETPWWSSPAWDHCEDGPPTDLDQRPRPTGLGPLYWDAGAFEVP